MLQNELEVPPHFDPEKLGQIWRVDYERLARSSPEWAGKYGIRPISEDAFKVCLILVDIQNTFCIPGFELYVGGRSGTGAVDDNVRLCRFIYRNLHRLTQIVPTMDTHHVAQVFHSIFLVDEKGDHPEPFTIVTEENVREGRWRFNPDLCETLNITPEYGRKYLEHYTRQLKESGKYNLTVWPYHAMIGGIGHALVPGVEEALFFHSVARSTHPDFHVKGENPFTEHYSVLGPEVTKGPGGKPIAGKSEKIFRKLTAYDAVAIAGQAKSHCVAWTIADLLEDVMARDPALVRKVYLLEDCTSPVVVPGVMDYTDKADEAFKRFGDAGMHVVRSTTPFSEWPGMDGYGAS